MGHKPLKLLVLCACVTAGVAHARPYPGISGLAATADSAATAAYNPAGMVRFDKRTMRGRLLGFFSESTWESEFDALPVQRKTDDSSTIVVPTGYLIQPLSDRWRFGFTVQGAGFSDDYGDWPGRYFIEDYELLQISAFPSLAYEVNDRFSVAGSLLLSYTTYEQNKAVLNFLDPGLGDGGATIDTDGFEVGFSLSTLYQFSPRTRFGLTYTSELQPEMDGKLKFKGLGTNTEAALQARGLINAKVDVESVTPQSVLAGIYHEFDNNHAVTLDVAWSDFSSFELSEIYINGDSTAETEGKYQDIWAFSASYSWPLNERWMLGVSGLYVDDMIKDDDRTLTLRLDSMWSVGVGFEWHWKKERYVSGSFAYMSVGDGPVATDPLPGLGSLRGEYTKRDTFIFEIGMSLGTPGG